MVKAIPDFLIVEILIFSAVEAGIRLPVVEQVAEAVHRVLEERCGCEYEHTDRWSDEWDHLKGGNESGKFPDKA